MILPWASRHSLELRREALQDELEELRGQISKKKKNIRRLEKDLYWGRISLAEMKAERKAFVRMQGRIRKVKKTLGGIDVRLGGNH